MLLLASIVVYLVYYDSAYAFIYARIRGMVLSYLNDAEIYAYIYAFIKKLLIGQLQDPEMTRQIQDTIVQIAKPRFPWSYISGGTILYLCWRYLGFGRR